MSPPKTKNVRQKMWAIQLFTVLIIPIETVDSAFLPVVDVKLTETPEKAPEGGCAC